MNRILCAPILALLTGAVLAQEAYSGRHITMVVPFPPGGVADLTGRPTAFAMDKDAAMLAAAVKRVGKVQDKK